MLATWMPRALRGEDCMPGTAEPRVEGVLGCQEEPLFMGAVGICPALSFSWFFGCGVLPPSAPRLGTGKQGCWVLQYLACSCLGGLCRKSSAFAESCVPPWVVPETELEPPQGSCFTHVCSGLQCHSDTPDTVGSFSRMCGMGTGRCHPTG